MECAVNKSLLLGSILLALSGCGGDDSSLPEQGSLPEVPSSPTVPTEPEPVVPPIGVVPPTDPVDPEPVEPEPVTPPIGTVSPSIINVDKTSVWYGNAAQPGVAQAQCRGCTTNEFSYTWTVDANDDGEFSVESGDFQVEGEEFSITHLSYGHAIQLTASHPEVAEAKSVVYEPPGDAVVDAQSLDAFQAALLTYDGTFVAGNYASNLPESLQFYSESTPKGLTQVFGNIVSEPSRGGYGLLGIDKEGKLNALLKTENMEKLGIYSLLADINISKVVAGLDQDDRLGLISDKGTAYVYSYDYAKPIDERAKLDVVENVKDLIIEEDGYIYLDNNGCVHWGSITGEDSRSFDDLACNISKLYSEGVGGYISVGLTKSGEVIGLSDTALQILHDSELPFVDYQGNGKELYIFDYHIIKLTDSDAEVFSGSSNGPTIINRVDHVFTNGADPLITTLDGKIYVNDERDQDLIVEESNPIDDIHSAADDPIAKIASSKLVDHGWVGISEKGIPIVIYGNNNAGHLSPGHVYEGVLDGIKVVDVKHNYPSLDWLFLFENDVATRISKNTSDFNTFQAEDVVRILATNGYVGNTNPNSDEDNIVESQFLIKRNGYIPSVDYMPSKEVRIAN
ncbi:hypothetical protein ACFLJY_004764 [Vibrio alginolyticus]